MIATSRAWLKVGGIVLAAIASIYCALFLMVQSGRVRAWAETELSTASGAAVRIASLRFRLPLGVVAENVEIAKPDSFRFTSPRLTAIVSPFDLFFGTIHRLELDGPQLELDIEALSRPTERKRGVISLRQLNVRDGRIALKRGAAVLFELPEINLDAQNFNLAGNTGVNLRADIPPLSAEMELALQGAKDAFQSDIVLRPKSARGSLDLPKSSQTREMLRLRSLIHLPENQKPSATLDAAARDFPIQAARLTGRFNAKIEGAADFSAAQFTGNIELENFFQAFNPQLDKPLNGKAAMNFTGAYARADKTLTLKTIEIASTLGAARGDAEMIFAAPQARLARALLHSQPIPLENLKGFLPAPLDQWTFQGQGIFDLEIRGPWNALEARGSARSDDARIRGGGFALENLSFRAPFAWFRPAWRIGEAQWTAVKLVYGEKTGWQASTERVQGVASADLATGQPVKISGRFESAGGKFASADGSKLGENLKIAGTFDLRSDAARRSISLGGDFRADGGEILWGKYFSDLKEPQPRLEIAADYQRDLDRLDCRRCRMTVTQVGAVDVSGSVERVAQGPELRLRAKSENFLAGGFYEQVLRPNFNREYPTLDHLAVGGALDFQCAIQGNAQDFSVQGDLALKGGMLSAKTDGWQVGPMSLSLPFQISWPQKAREANLKPRYGVLAIEQARFADEQVGKIATAVALSNNALLFPQSVRVEIFGGAVEFNALRWPDVVNAPKQLSFSAEAKALRLERLTPTFGWRPFSGTLSGSIPQVQSSASVLQTKGEIRAAVFGGDARLSRLEIENPFSSLAAIRLDARLSNIDLEQLTKTFSFGRISGILEGSIDDLVIVNGQPAQLQVDLHSVDRGKEQRISVEALNKITVLSSGASAGALYSGLAGFFDNFGYGKLGFKARLKNDRLTLRGVESRGDEEYLVVGSFLPPRVNVVSHTQEIAFTELLRRLERIKSEPAPAK